MCCSSSPQKPMLCMLCTVHTCSYLTVSTSCVHLMYSSYSHRYWLLVMTLCDLVILLGDLGVCYCTTVLWLSLLLCVVLALQQV